jgi:hypothetical protein
MFKMREIKFRAWDKKRKKMWYPENMYHGHMVDPNNSGSLIHSDIEQIAIGADGTIYILDECGNYEYAVNGGEDYEVLRWTGLKDKNDKDIYDGDILYNPHDSIGHYLVVWDNQEERFALGYGDKHPLGYYNPDQWWEVTGNIYENPELLKEVENG